MDYASVVGWRNASKYAFVFLPPTLESTGRRNLHPKGCGNTRLSSRSQQNLFSPTDFLVSFQFIFYVKTQHGVLQLWKWTPFLPKLFAPEWQGQQKYNFIVQMQRLVGCASLLSSTCARECGCGFHDFTRSEPAVSRGHLQTYRQVWSPCVSTL